MKFNRHKCLVIILLIFSFVLGVSAASYAVDLTVVSNNGSVDYDDGTNSETIVSEAEAQDTITGYADGDTVELTANASAGYQFIGWIDGNGDAILDNTPTNNPVTITMGSSDRTIQAIYLSGNSSNYGSFDYDDTNFPDIELIGNADDGFEFDNWTGDVPTDQQNQNPTTITMDGDKSVTANFRKGTVSNFTIGPSYLVFNTGTREYDFRPEANNEEGISEDVELDFEFSTNASNIYLVRKGSTTAISSAGVGESSGALYYKTANQNVVLTNNGLSSLELGETFEVRLGSTNGPVLVTFTIKGAYPQPKIEVSLDGHSQYGVLDPDEVYFVKEKDNLSVDITANSDLSNQQQVNSILSTKPEFLGADVDLTSLTWEDIDDSSNIDEVLNGNLEDKWRTDSYTDNDNWEMDDDPFVNAINNIGEGLTVAAVRMKAYALGAREYADQMYYFALDRGKPEVTSVNPGVDLEELSGETAENQRDLVDTNAADSDEPYIKLTFDEALSGIDTDTLEIRGIKVDDGKSINEIVTDYRTDYDQTFDNNADQYFELIDYDQQADEATILPKTALDEGRYVVRVTVQDEAGNINDNDGNDGDDSTRGYTFLLKIDNNQPIINNITIRDDNGIETDNIISTEGGRLQFDVHNSEELRYQVRARADVGNTWTYKTEDKLDNKTKFINQTFADLGVTLEDGTYEVIMVADDIKIQDEVVSAIEEIDTDAESDIEAEVETAIEAALNDQGLRLDDARTEVRAFRFEVDGTPPSIKDIRYITPDNQEVEPDGDGSFGVLYTRTPVFQVTISDQSKLEDPDIDIGGFSAGVIKEETSEENGEKVSKIQFTPNTPLDDGMYSIQIDIEDKWGNLESKSYDNIFEVQNVATDINFSIDPGDRLSIKEASAIEVSLPEDKDLDKSTLQVEINGKVIINGKSKVADANDFEVIPFNDWDRFIIFAAYPLSVGRNELRVTVEDQVGNQTWNSVAFTVDNYREGFGFGRLGKFLLEKADKLN
ncbi:MAG: InlB B-repeat-containing protein [Bacillota bacterium]